MLIADDTVEDWNEYTLIPCVVKDLDKIKLPLSDENKEKYAIITTNKEARKYSDADKYNEMQAWKEIIEELRLKGVESITGEDENGEKNKIQIKGEKQEIYLLMQQECQEVKYNALKKYIIMQIQIYLMQCWMITYQLELQKKQ